MKTAVGRDFRAEPMRGGKPVEKEQTVEFSCAIGESAVQIFRAANVTRADGSAVIGKPDAGLMCLPSLASHLDRLQLPR